MLKVFADFLIGFVFEKLRTSGDQRFDKLDAILSGSAAGCGNLLGGFLPVFLCGRD